jgi:hypothetical protein
MEREAHRITDSLPFEIYSVIPGHSDQFPQAPCFGISGGFSLEESEMIFSE